MKNYKPESYSKQARRLADNYLEWDNLKEAETSLLNTYHCNLIKYRAVKRFGRKIKKSSKIS